MSAIRHFLYRDMGFKVSTKDLWAELGRLKRSRELTPAWDWHASRVGVVKLNGNDPNSGSNSPSSDENLQVHPSFKEVSNPPSAQEKSYDSYFAFRRVRSASATPAPSPSPPPGPTRTGSAPDSSIRGSDVGKKQRHKEKLKLAGLDDSDSSALTQSGDEAEESSPPLQDQLKPGTEGDTEVGEDGNGGTFIACSSEHPLFPSPIASTLRKRIIFRRGHPYPRQLWALLFSPERGIAPSPPSHNSLHRGLNIFDFAGPKIRAVDDLFSDSTLLPPSKTRSGTVLRYHTQRHEAQEPTLVLLRRVLLNDDTLFAIKTRGAGTEAFTAKYLNRAVCRHIEFSPPPSAGPPWIREDLGTGDEITEAKLDQGRMI
ncbi:hypothetical protein BJ322DRAFT_1220394 [Thelephora terrestris]|uniref:Uncharacterized protein n=1 Tax=Thelephora terrestris TaxID=56493 RepID=A0A9P6H850_9AGAM|nr:hypothetical protein BJ322DRAFT_1220394 [Thelephora terrestris]